jgi:AraC family transcriptional activator of mtrCDE
MSDALATILRHVRIEASLFGRIELGAPWGARLPPAAEIAIHHLLEGEMWLEIEGRDLHIERGDLLVLPHGRPHCLRHAPGAPVVEPAHWMARATPGAHAVRRRLGGPGRRTIVLCAALRATGAGRALLLRSLPLAVHISGRSAEPVPGLDRLLDGIRDEVREGRPGSGVIAARFAELLLLQALRVELERRAADAALPTVVGDAHVGRALEAIYATPQRSWTVERLARLAGQSRSGFARAFREQVGEGPLRHLTRWRIELAKEQLATAGTSLAEIALGVGYRNEAAFNVAFRREAGMPPGAYRRHALQRPATIA